MLAVLAGCSSAPSYNPVTWFHNLEGGEIAKQRPPPPGANEPYPNLATVPNKAPALDPAQRQQIENGLIADRTNAREVAAASPLPDPSSPAASPALFGRGSLPPPGPPDQGAATASLEAATAPPVPPPAPSPAPSITTAQPAPPPTQPNLATNPPARAPVTAVQLAPPASPPASPAAPASASASQPVSLPVPAPTPAPPDNPATLPALPTAPPRPVILPGVPAVPNSSARTAQAAPPVRPAATRVARSTAGPQMPPAMDLTFPPGSASLPADAVARLQSLAARRGTAVLAVTGHGDAASDDPGVQSTALALGLSRAQAIAATLTGAGVPPAGVRVDAEASGQGAVVRLVE